MTKLLVVDDDAHIRELVKVFLQNEGLEVIEAIDGVDALSKLDTEKIDMVVMDIMMPNMDGWALCEEIRSFNTDLPILMLTAKGETSQKIKGFHLGTDDYLVKPFEPAELIVRVKSILKRYRISLSQVLEAGNVKLNRHTYEVEMNGETILLRLKEFELLFTLASYVGKTFSREQLIEEIWGYDYEGDERTVDVHIKRIRERFPQETSGITIRTIRGLGYRLELGT
ncbi:MULTISPECIES: response regulator transcription factor [Lysinibacillus]|uniref:response regulator transcription factor n=1 Tax=Lysinibacillus TaxID=400634 RepID=UPI00214BCBC6|nr:MULTISPECIES: response regulator transcription factor [Lysinibacillus]UNT54198.1 response regulator transcription factor [Lysinibacillus capsici]UUV26169.1 response regulator transcription factor [Lysinibacillus sp. FN11]UYB49042.1 response regulator transcription factor [Lysinibacillus capsici]WDU81024.1 response regulator transcription factor [Lysinibacillus sp. G01H]